MSDEEPDSATNARPQLHGWKDISAYFGRSVRTVQRWERDYALPIRRYGMGRAELVHAYIDDLEQWKATAEAQAARRAADPAGDEPPDSQEIGTNGAANAPAAAAAGLTDDAGARRSRLPLGVVLSVLLLLLSVGAIVAWRSLTGREGREARDVRAGGRTVTGGVASPPGAPAADGADLQPADWDLALDTLSAMNAKGAVLWRHQFPFSLQAQPSSRAADSPDLPVRIRDIDGDGSREVVVSSWPADARSEHYRFFCFNSAGALLWTYAREGSQVFGDTTYAAPFLANRILFTPREGRGEHVWLVSVHRPWFPSVMSRLEIDGKVSAEYWSAGYITAIWEGVVAGRRVMLVGARNNESAGASLAMLDAAHPTGSAPAEQPRYLCRTCPPGAPLRFVKFPQLKRLRALGGTDPVIRISVDSASRITVWVATAHDTQVQPRPDVIYTLDAELRPLAVGLNDAFDSAVNSLAHRGLIPAPPSTPALDEARTVRWWDGARFIDLAAPAARQP